MIETITNDDLYDKLDMYDLNYIPENLNEITIKKRKGRKTQKEKELEKSNIESSKKKFPTLNEKIFDVVEINKTEYFYDQEFNMLFDHDTNPIGFKYGSNYVFYSDSSKDIEKIQTDNKYVKQLLETVGI